MCVCAFDRGIRASRGLRGLLSTSTHQRTCTSKEKRWVLLWFYFKCPEVLIVVDCRGNVCVSWPTLVRFYLLLGCAADLVLLVLILSSVGSSGFSWS